MDLEEKYSEAQVVNLPSIGYPTDRTGSEVDSKLTMGMLSFECLQQIIVCMEEENKNLKQQNEYLVSKLHAKN